MLKFVRQGFFLFVVISAVLAFPISEKESLYEDPAVNIQSQSLLELNIGVEVTGGILREGDIFIEQKNRHAVANQRLTWRGRHVPYEIETVFDQDQNNIITSTMKDLHDLVGDDCINFIPKVDSDHDYLYIRTGNGCYSDVGRNGGRQNMTLAPGCLYRGTIIHELMHTLGFWHEHTRPDRDQHINVLWDNIANQMDPNFVRMDERDVVLLDRYDYYSIMHYSPYAFSGNNLPTIQITDSSVNVSMVGQRLNPSDLDITKIRKLYKCDQQECENPGVLKDGGMSKIDPYVGSKVTYKCNDGFVLIGPSERICTDNGTWTGDTPVCLDPTKGNYHYCNFDNSSICGWQGNWTWTTLPTPLKYTGPTWDHTWDSSIGGYVYASGVKLYNSSKSLSIISPAIPIDENVDYCITFTSLMYGEMMGSLNISSTACGDTVTLHSWHGNQGDTWNRVTLRVKLPCASQVFQISFEAGKSMSTESDIAIDDVLIADCTTIQSFLNDQEFNMKGTQSKSCNFSVSLCDWLQNSDDDFDWTLKRGPTRTFGTGPDCDRTNCSNGQYLYIETSGQRSEGEVAKLSSFPLKDNWFYCFSFYYNMFGESTGNLSLLKTTPANKTLLWSKAGNQGKMWQRASVEFNTSSNEKLVIQATRGRGYRGDIAVDDFELRSGGCRKVLDCSFEDDFCTWTNENTSDVFDWLRYRGPTSTPGTGPTKDHTSGKGFYIYMEASSPRIITDTARLSSPFLPPTPWGYCVRFWLLMYGRDMGSLRMIISDQNGNETVKWNLHGEQSNQWQSYSVFIESPFLTNRIVFEGEVGPSYRSDIAIDDISIREDNCYA
ncbi:MAM and LDL-receptor class A domain-containing protein 1-like isoform X2 [Argopecten irradians]|uniref:MAM and LDL-receptor class A domain-containing protein 1-like isoform X2 n=1 Tax=Argopecten irradians TaxID=31199 RepID=UPI003722BFF1